MNTFALLHASRLWLLAGVIPVVLLYVLQARRRVVRVPSTWLWQAAQRDVQARTPFRKLRRELPLILELSALALLALAAATPSCRGRSITGAHVAIVVDVSASMSAIDPLTRRSRIDDARTTVRRLIDSLAVGSDAMLITAGRDPRVVSPLGRDREGLRHAADSLVALPVEGDIAAGVALAIDRLRPLSGASRTLVVSDGLAGRTDTLPRGPIPVQLVRVGSPLDNAGIVRFDVRTARQGRETETVQAFALVANDGAIARDLYVTARRDGSADIVSSRRVRIEPNTREPVVLEFPLTAADVGSGLVVELSPHDSLAADDVAYGRIPPGAALPVDLVTRSSSAWVERALTADPDATLRRLAPDALATVTPQSLLVFDGVCPTPLPDRHDVLVLDPPPGRCDAVVVGDPFDAPAITSYAQTDARFRFLSLDGVHIARATPLQLGSHATEILRAGTATLGADASSPEHTVTILGFDVEDTDWPLRASFVLFVRNVEELARAHRARAVTGGGRTGEPLRVAVPAGVSEVTVDGPAGRAHVRVTRGTAVIGDTTHSGLYRITYRAGETLAPVNLLSDLETNLRGPTLRLDDPGHATDSLVQPHQDLTPWFAIAAAAFLLANLWWLTRRERAPVTRIAQATRTVRT